MGNNTEDVKKVQEDNLADVTTTDIGVDDVTKKLEGSVSSGLADVDEVENIAIKYAEVSDSTVKDNGETINLQDDIEDVNKRYIEVEQKEIDVENNEAALKIDTFENSLDSVVGNTSKRVKRPSILVDEGISSVNTHKRNKKGLKGVNFKLLKILLVLFLAFLMMFLPSFVKEVQIRQSHQGELIFYVLDGKDIELPEVKKWYLANYQSKGIYTYDDRLNNEKYILLSAGEQEVENLEIQIDSLVGFEDKIIVNGKVKVPLENMETGLAYTHTIVKIAKDVRDISLGTLNLYDPFRGITDDGTFETEGTKQAKGIFLDVGIVNRVIEDKIELVTLNGNEKVYNSKVFILDIKESKKLKKGDLVSIKIKQDNLQAFPVVQELNILLDSINELKITAVDKETRELTVTEQGVSFKYPAYDKLDINKLILNDDYLIKFKVIDGVTYISEIMGV